ncbi:14772_t:CDS:2, partial [Dentiscutata heterogama]
MKWINTTWATTAKDFEVKTLRAFYSELEIKPYKISTPVNSNNPVK